jgi:lipoprotein-releasing system permease protein
MYKLLLSWRYLKTRFIALASIVSVTLGVATLIVVNSVMAGFVDQMKNRLHGILSDVEIAAPMMEEIQHPARNAELIRQIVGNDLEEMTWVVRTQALLTLDFNGRQWTQTVMLLGIDDDSFGKVTDFQPYLTNAIKREQQFNFQLEESGYEKFEQAGWNYRRQKVESKRELDRMLREHDQLYNQTSQEYLEANPLPELATSDSQQSEKAAERALPQFAPLPDSVPDINQVMAKQAESGTSSQATDQSEGPPSRRVAMPAFDPHMQYRDGFSDEELFDPMRDQYTGIVLGLAISARKTMNKNNELEDVYLARPGDDVQMTMLSAGRQLRPVTENFTIVDFYSSNMHEYDSSFAFVPLSELQNLCGMVDPLTGEGMVSAFQLKLKPGADLAAVRDRLKSEFPGAEYLDIRTWQDTQRPLLSAVQMELTILNILLFLIIAVAGFGILATFFMIVVEKTRDIGILKALGAPSQGVMSIFLGYGMSLGTVGTGVGIGLGLAFVAYINQIADVVGWLTGQEVFDPTIYYFSEIPTIVSPLMVLLVAAGAIMIAVLASVLPALRAARLHPVEALRYE